MTTQSAKQQHTPGPWRVLALDWRSDATGRISAGIATDKEPPHFVSCDSMSLDPLADARRIVACVNACEGISTDALNAATAAVAAGEMPMLRSEVAALRTALEGCVYSLDWHRVQGNLVGMDQHHLDVAYAALGAKS